MTLALYLTAAGLCGAGAMYATMHWFGLPNRIVHQWEDELLRAEIEQARVAPLSDTGRGYVNGLRIAAILLGTCEPTTRPQQRLRRKVTA